MSTDPVNLLKMLEPAVRPGGAAPTATRGAAPVPFEARSFEQLLQEAKPADTPAPASAPGPGPHNNAPPVPPAPPNHPLRGLADISRIENASLRQQLEAARVSGQAPTPDLNP